MKLHVNKLSCIRQHHSIFKNISFALETGNALFIQGENGCGKSSLLRLLSGLSTPASGNIFWNEQNIQENKVNYWQDLHYIGHTNGIKLGLTVLENLQLMSHLAEQPLVDCESVLLLLQLHNHKNTQAKYLSAGQKRKLALAKLFLFPKKLWILDEPFTALDVNMQEIFLTQLEKHLANGGISVISTHHPITFQNSSTQILRLSA